MSASECVCVRVCFYLGIPVAGSIMVIVMVTVIVVTIAIIVIGVVAVPVGILIRDPLVHAQN